MMTRMADDPGPRQSHRRVPGSFSIPAGSVATVAQILALDVVFSLDSVITAVGMARALPVMVLAMIIAVGVMFIFANLLAEFINRHPSMKILALAFLLLIGVLLVADSLQMLNPVFDRFDMAEHHRRARLQS